MEFLESINSLLWNNNVLYFVLLVGVMFTLWSRFCQFKAVTHGTKVILGHFEEESNPGAISHFQALSAALSATVGLGNIAGVAIAVSIGGPGAVFWMWIVGFIGMALKTFEVTQSMLYRNIDNPKEPHGGPMWVAQNGFAKMGYKKFGKIVATIFCVTLLISTVTGGNMFQAWNVADITFSYFGIPQMATGAILFVLVALVILGGIKRIGSVAGTLVPFMCGVYLLGALYIVFTNIETVPSLLILIFKSGLPEFLGGEKTLPIGAFVGGTVGFAFLKGMQRALFSNEAGQGSAPIAHSAAQTSEPVREGIVAGLEPLIDTLFVCTVTALVILLSGSWNRSPDINFKESSLFTQTQENTWVLSESPLPKDALVNPGESVFTVIEKAEINPNTESYLYRISGQVVASEQNNLKIVWEPVLSSSQPKIHQNGAFIEYKGATLTARSFDRVLPGLGYWIVPLAVWLFALSTMISWSYYGEQGVVYLFGEKWVKTYRIIYCVFVFLACTSIIKTEYELDVISTLGTGVMLFVNIPIMIIFAKESINAYFDYNKRLKNGEFDNK